VVRMEMEVEVIVILSILVDKGECSSAVEFCPVFALLQCSDQFVKDFSVAYAT